MPLEKLFERREEGAAQCSILYPMWNGAKFIRETLPAVLGQQGVRAEVLVSDDGSEDGSLAAAMEIAQAYRGPHDVVVYRTGSRAEFEHVPRLAAAARTSVLIQAHQDDVSFPGRARTLVAAFRPGVYLATSTARWRRKGKRLTMNEKLLARVRSFKTFEPFLYSAQGVMIGARFGMHADLFRKFPRLERGYLTGGLDIILPLRALMLGQVVRIDRPLVLCTEHKERWSYRVWDMKNAETMEFARALRRLAVFERALAELAEAHRAGLVTKARHGRLLGWIQRARAYFVEQAIANHEALVRQGFRLAWAPPGAAA